MTLNLDDNVNLSAIPPPDNEINIRIGAVIDEEIFYDNGKMVQKNVLQLKGKVRSTTRHAVFKPGYKEKRSGIKLPSSNTHGNHKVTTTSSHQRLINQIQYLGAPKKGPNSFKRIGRSTDTVGAEVIFEPNI